MADILIRGMEMPTKCADCYLVVFGWCCCLQKYVAYDSKPLNCPLAPLPEGHGRLIDADAIMTNIGEVPYKGSVRRVLMSAPTIVPAKGGGEDG